MFNRNTISLFVLGLFQVGSVGCSSVPVNEEVSSDDDVTLAAQGLSDCSLANAVPLRGPNIANRLGANACVAVIPPFLPPWWQYSDGTLRVQIANHDDQDPNENAFPFDVQWENTCGTEQGTASYPQAWQQRELGHPSSQCSIVMKLGGRSTEDVLVFWGA